MRRLRQGASSSRNRRQNGMGSLRERAAETRCIAGALRRLPRGERFGIKDLPRSLRQQQILGEGERDLVNRLEAEARAGRQGRIADYLTRKDFTVLDELGYCLSLKPAGNCFSISSAKLYER